MKYFIQNANIGKAIFHARDVKIYTTVTLVRYHQLLLDKGENKA